MLQKLRLTDKFKIRMANFYFVGILELRQGRLIDSRYVDSRDVDDPTSITLMSIGHNVDRS